MTSPKLVTSAASLSFCLIFFLTGCAAYSNGNSNHSNNQTPNDGFSIAVAPVSANVAQGGSASVSANISAQGGFNAPVQLNVSGLPSGVTASLSSSAVNGSGDPTISIKASSTVAAGTYPVVITGVSGALMQRASFHLAVLNYGRPPDFSISASSASQTVTAGGSTSLTVGVGAINGFEGTVGLVESGLPAGMQVSCGPASIRGSGICTLNISTARSTAAGTYPLTITGTSGSLTHQTSIDVTVKAATTVSPDFSLSATPATQALNAGSSTALTVTVGALNGFTGTVGLVESGMPAGMLAGCSPSSIVKSGSCALTITTTTSTPAGTYPLMITGTSGNLKHSAPVSVTVNGTTASPDFTLSAAPASETITPGSSTTFAATLGAQNGFTGIVKLAALGLPAGVTASFAPPSITTSGSSTLTLTSTSTTQGGTYTLTIEGVSATQVHNTNVSLAVTTANSGAALNVLMFPGATSDPYFGDIATYLFTNNVVNGATIAIEWSGSDQGPSAGADQYNWTYPDGQMQPWIQAGKKVNLVIWAVADNSNNQCGPEAQYGSANIGNCAVPAYVWTAMGSSNATVCTSQYGTQQLPNYFASAFWSNYQKFMAAAIEHYRGNPNVGYIRFGLGHGGETIPVAGWSDTSTPCGQAYVNAWGVTTTSWEDYLGSMVDYEGSLHSPIQLMMGLNALGVPDSRLAPWEAPVAVQNNVGFGSQGLEESDVNNCSGATSDWCELFGEYTGQVPLELQTVGQSCPDNTCATGSLVNLIPFAVSNHTKIFELYYQDWLTAYDPNYPGYFPAYQPVLQAAAGQ
jgi:uncharacterized membrane protein